MKTVQLLATGSQNIALSLRNKMKLLFKSHLLDGWIIRYS